MQHIGREVFQNLAKLALNSVLLGGELVDRIEFVVQLDSKDVNIYQEKGLLDDKVATLLACALLNRLRIRD
jgi:hypothetical protein